MVVFCHSHHPPMLCVEDFEDVLLFHHWNEEFNEDEGLCSGFFHFLSSLCFGIKHEGISQTAERYRLLAELPCAIPSPPPSPTLALSCLTKRETKVMLFDQEAEHKNVNTVDSIIAAANRALKRQKNHHHHQTKLIAQAFYAGWGGRSQFSTCLRLSSPLSSNFMSRHGLDRLLLAPSVIVNFFNTGNMDPLNFYFHNTTTKKSVTTPSNTFKEPRQSVEHFVSFLLTVLRRKPDGVLICKGPTVRQRNNSIKFDFVFKGTTVIKERFACWYPKAPPSDVASSSAMAMVVSLREKNVAYETENNGTFTLFLDQQQEYFVGADVTYDVVAARASPTNMTLI